MKTNNINFSINGAGTSSCSGGCVYCSAATTLDYAMGVNKNDVVKSLKAIDEKTYGEFKADYNKLTETLEHNSRFRRAKEIQEKEGIQGKVHIDFWSADPVTCHLVTQDVYDFLKDFFEDKHGMKLQFSSSTNGLPLCRDEIAEWYEKTGSTLQISHDGCGQWMRTGDIDPLYYEHSADNIARLFNNGTLNMVNCLNSFYNGDVFANKKYWDDYFKSINMKKDVYSKLYIKLNRIYDGKYYIYKKNVNGIFGSDKRVWEELKNTEFGNMAHHNRIVKTGNLELDHLMAHELDDYLAQWLQLAIMMRDPNVTNNLMWQPYKGYISEQVNRWKWVPNRDNSSGCRTFQRTVAQAGDPKNWKKPNDFGEIEHFVIDTLGGYCECNLIDSEHHVKNFGCIEEPPQCKICRYYLQSECNGCGSEVFTDDCTFRYRWVRLLEQVKNMDAMMKSNKNHQKNVIISDISNIMGDKKKTVRSTKR